MPFLAFVLPEGRFGVVGWVLSAAVVANVLTAIAYFGIAAYVAPRFRLPKLSDAKVRLARLFVMIFLVLAGIVHVELVAAAYLGEVGTWFVSWRGMGNHIFQALAVWAFFFVSRRNLSVKVFERDFYDSVLADYLRELEAVRGHGVVLGYENHKVWSARIDVAVNGGIAPVFQPIVNIHSGKTVGFEALSRFPGYPDAKPDQWFLLASHLGRGVELEVAAVRAALDYADDLPPGTYMTLNVSQDTFVSLELIEALSENEGLHRFVLEITEQVPIVRYKPLRDAAEMIRHLGLRIAVDDMGSGFASMRRVVELHPEIIKIDRSLTRRLAVSEYEQAFVLSISRYVQTVGATIVVEGIETDEQVRVLRGLGARFAQGWYYGKPGELPPV